ncbi:carbohydrate ABC transporter permease [Salinisphaera sp.]|uniref:carbohydrate ABC transporter permease n=1 Tax=Salinisphaera sp. TaxID=1914330 RepID=UPI002D79BEED|nr:carbohydrate ABC transporter permease [Salinisphaera sp.]HET7313558.1 carbohydrate ABC transporter permease [Salinisphaera sp.]
MFPKPIQKRSTATGIAYRVAVPVVLLLWLLPLIAVFLTSIRSLADINAGNYWGMPSQLSLIENYAAVFQQTPMLRYLINSLVITIPAVAGAIALATIAGFALAKYRFRGNILLFALFVGGNFVPFQILMVPVRTFSLHLGLYDTYWALILFHMAFQSGFCVFFMRNFIAELPDDLLEVARTEGVGEFKIFIYIILPLVRPALAALSVLIFTYVWNDYFWALVLVQSDSVRPVTTALQTLQGHFTASWQLVSAAAIIAALPPVALFFAMQRHFVAGLTLGATKG